MKQASKRHDVGQSRDAVIEPGTKKIMHIVSQDTAR